MAPFLDTYLEFIFNFSLTQILFAFTVIMLSIYYGFFQYRGVPPGPTGIPVLGYWPFIRDENGNLQMEELKNRYGDVFSFSVTGHLCICLSSFKAIKEAHISKADFFGDRFSAYSLLTHSFDEGVAFVNGESWKVQRKFFLQKFKEYGMLAIKDSFSASVYDNLNDTGEEIRGMEGKPFPILDVLTVKCSKIIRRILFNDQGFTEDDLKELNHEYGYVMASMTNKNLLLMGNIARYFVFPFMPCYWAMIRSHNNIQNTLKKVIQRHKENFDENQVMDIIDSFYKEKKDREKKGDPTAKYFTDKALISSVYQFVTDGVLTVAFFIFLFLEKLLESPEEQEKIYKELMDVLGPDRQPTMEDKSNLPYTNAFIYEVVRCTGSFPTFPSQQCTRETTLRGYRIPRGAITVISSWCANHDPNVYDDPYSFNPSRFVSEGGKKKTELPVTFGVGRRACMGEPFTHIQAFLFVATIVKNFRLTKPENMGTLSYAEPGDVKICAHVRKQGFETKIENQ